MSRLRQTCQQVQPTRNVLWNIALACACARAREAKLRFQPDFDDSPRRCVGARARVCARARGTASSRRWGFVAGIMAKKGVVLCGRKWKGRCDIHDRKCSIPVEFPSGDSRLDFVAKMRRMGGQSHSADSDHRCDLCERERQEGRHAGWYRTDPKDGKVKPTALVERLEKERREKRERIEKEKRKRAKRHRDSQ